jgi:hypothetical protein
MECYIPEMVSRSSQIAFDIRATDTDSAEVKPYIYASNISSPGLRINIEAIDFVSPGTDINIYAEAASSRETFADN